MSWLRLSNVSRTSALRCARKAPSYEQVACRPRFTHARQGDRESHRILAALHEEQATMERRRSWGLTLGRGMVHAWRRSTTTTTKAAASQVVRGGANECNGTARRVGRVRGDSRAETDRRRLDIPTDTTAARSEVLVITVVPYLPMLAC